MLRVTISVMLTQTTNGKLLMKLKFSSITDAIRANSMFTECLETY